MNSFSTGYRRPSLLLAMGIALLVLPLGILCLLNPADAKPPTIPRDRIVVGDIALVADNMGIPHPVVTWALVTPDDDVEEVGVTIPVALFDNQPLEHGDGPHGAIASLAFPELVRELTYFDHFEMHTQPIGHEAPPFFANPNRNRLPHFDFHFYAIPEAEVWAIPEIRPWPNPLLPDVAPERLPAGYIQPVFSALEMGRHSNPIYSMIDPEPLETTMIAGFLPDASLMHFIEPMISREFLLERNDFELPVPMPEEFGRLMLYPTKCEAEYDPVSDAYHFIFSKFVVVE
jgi:hypothetical protein